MVYNKNGPKHQGRKGRYVGTHWHDDIVVIPDADRVMPPTVPHSIIVTHRLGCQCVPCQEYGPDLLRHVRQVTRKNQKIEQRPRWPAAAG